MEQQQTAIVIGAGIVGVSCAIWLQRAGLSVTLIDRDGPASGTSYGNAGVLAAASIVPVPVPGLLRKASAMLADASSPLFLRWSYLPKLMPFLARYLARANSRDVAQTADALSPLLHDAADQHRALAAGTEAESFLDPGDYIFAYADRAAFEADAMAWTLRRERGHPFEEMDGVAIAAYDPILADRFQYAVRCPDHGRISDPGAYVQALAAHFEAGGGRFVRADVTDIESGNVTTQTETLAADHIVLATGIWSGPLARKLGIAVPMEAERGYHIEFVNPSIMPKAPVMVASGKFVMTPMEGRLRCAGIVEFGGMSPERSRAPLDLLKRQTLDFLPDLTYDRIDEWMGMRPSTSDSIPLIGESAVANVWTAFGHHHVGLTAGPKTGRWIADLVAGHKPNVDLAPYAPSRFTQSRKTNGRNDR